MAATQVTSAERYELIDRIAVGGMAEVFRAVAYGAHGFEKALAIKRILPELASDPEFEERFIGEAKLAVKLTHANVVQVLDFGRLAGSLFIAMELVDGLDLAALLRRHRAAGALIPVPAAFHIAVEIARGLDFAHQHGVVHRDISPSNILLSRAGEVKIADFGIAQAASDRRSDRLGRRRIMGKWRYMSPEQTRGETLGTRSDLFSAAAVWFELFTGDKLFPGDEADTIIDNICRMAIPRASERRSTLPPRLDQVLRHALERDPARRPEKAAELLRALVEISYESSIVATALDVSAAVGEALATARPTADDSLPPRPLDDFIRQLVPADDPTRQTAVGNRPGAGSAGWRRRADGQESAAPSGPPTARPSSPLASVPSIGPSVDGETSTGVTLIRGGIDPDGVTNWVVEDGAAPEVSDRLTTAAAPAALRSGRRPSEASPIDAIRDEEVAVGAAEAGAGTEQGKGGRRWRRARLALLAGALAAVGVAALAWHGLGARAVAPQPGATASHLVSDPRPAGRTETGGTRMAVLAIDSLPPGAHVRLDGRRLPGVTPTSTDIEPQVLHRVELALDGFQPWVDGRVSARPGENVRIMTTLVAQRASLRVSTRPAGAVVTLDGETLGETPLDRDDLKPGRRVLALRKPGYKPIDLQIELIDGRRRDVDRRLDSAIAYGKIKINIRESWAEVSLNGRSVGRAPGILRLPVGQQRLRLYNPFSKRERTVTVEVRADQTAPYEFEL